jgi:hypothetical protein
MSKEISPSERLKEIKASPGKLREPDHINQYLEIEEFITIVEKKDGKIKYGITHSGETILSKLK